MKSPRPAGLVLCLAVTALVAVSASRGQDLALASMPALAELDSATLTIAARKACRFGQRYSPYFRRCVLWAPFDIG